MAPWKLHSVVDTIKYKSFLASWSTFIVFSFYCGFVVVPFLILFRIGNIFPTDRDYEQPSILFTKLFSISVKTSRSGKDAIKYTTLNGTNIFKPWNFRIPMLITQELDDDGDGLKDRLRLELRMPMLANETVHEVDLLMAFNYTLKRLDSKFESVVRIHSSQNLSRVGSLKVVGSTRLVQLGLLQGPQMLGFDKINKRVGRSCSKLFSINTDVFQVVSCNAETQAHFELSSTKYSWQPVQLAERAFVLIASIDYSTKQEVMYHVNHWLAMKWLYVQLAMLFLVLYIPGKALLGYLFDSQLADTIVMGDESQVKVKTS